MVRSQKTAKSLRLLDRGEWVFIRRLDARVERTEEPVELSLEKAVEWIMKEKPLIWLGSIFSVPSGFPSGSALTKSLLEMLIPNTIPEEQKEKLFNALLPRWPLEALLDEFEFVGFDLSESLLNFFKEKEEAASPNVLHHAVALYYQKGLARSPLCITSNWDNLQEKAFAEHGYKTIVAGPGKVPGKEFGKKGGDPKAMFIYHPHGSFETRDVVCSYKREQRQLTFSMEFMFYPTLFLGYSGYEPSLYEHLMYTAGQLWCIRDRSDLDIPAKRRLLCRPNTFVYIGDFRELLHGLGLLDNNVDLESKYVRYAPGVPSKIIEVLQPAVVASLDPAFCVDQLVAGLLSFLDEPEATISYILLMRALVDHVRNRLWHPGILPALMTAARFRDSEQIWISTLAYLLRVSTNLESRIIKHLLQYSEEARKKIGEVDSPYDLGVYSPGVLLARSEIYKRYVGQASKFDDEWESIREWTYQVLPIAGADMAAAGEFADVLAFEYLREDEFELSRNCFDYAATQYYLRGLWNSGQLNEWAAKNIELLLDISSKNTLMIRVSEP